MESAAANFMDGSLVNEADDDSQTNGFTLLSRSLSLRQSVWLIFNKVHSIAAHSPTDRDRTHYNELRVPFNRAARRPA